VNPPNTVPGRAAIVWFVLFLCIAAGLQSAFAARLTLFGGQPDFVLTLTLSAALLSDAAVGCLVGMAGGMVAAATVGQTVGTFLVSRIIAGYCAGTLTSRLYRGNIGVIFLGVLATTTIAEVAYVLSAPGGSLRIWAQSVAVSALMNAVIALPLTALLRRCGWGHNRL
jgi:cell shape-determining protein MreD